jgi:hypothetical protein
VGEADARNADSTHDYLVTSELEIGREAPIVGFRRHMKQDAALPLDGGVSERIRLGDPAGI